MGVSCQILLNKTREGVYKAGQPVNGVVKYAIDKQTEYKDIVLSLLGTGYCSWTESSSTTSSDGSSVSSSTTYTGKEEYVKRHINLLNKRPGETLVLHTGSYEYPFEFILPNDIPPSFKNEICTISYKIKLIFEKPQFFSMKKKFSAELPVYGYVDTQSPEGPVIFGLEKTLMKPFSTRIHKVNLKAEISKTWVTPGENFELSLIVSNDSDVTITSLKAQICSFTTYTADCGRTKSSVDDIKGCVIATASIPSNQVTKLSCVIPTLPELYSIQNSKVMVKEYKVRVTLRLPLPHKNAVVDMPIVIGERIGSVGINLEAMDDDTFGSVGSDPTCGASGRGFESRWGHSFV